MHATARTMQSASDEGRGAAASVISPFPYRPIRGGGGTVYVHRWRLLESEGYTLWLHNIVSSDPNGAWHDHPWDFCSLILAGGFDEQRQIGDQMVTTRLRAGDYYERAACERHGYTLVEPTWSLFVSGPPQRDSRFYLPDGRAVDWQTYMDSLA